MYRKVSVKQYDINPASGRWVPNGEFKEGAFHQWGCQFEEFEAGPGNVTMAIVEYDDGEVKFIGVEDIKFLDR